MKNFTFDKLNPRFAQFRGPLFITGQDLYKSDTVQNHPIGQMAYADGSKIFRYAYVGGSALVAGNMLQSAAEDTTMENMAVLASPIIAAQAGVQTVNVTNGTSTITSAQFSNGNLGVVTTPDFGSQYTILGVTGTLTTGGALTVTLDHPLTTAWTTATEVFMKPNPWWGVIQAPATTQTGILVGVINWAPALNTYCWVQTHGPTAVLSDGSTFAVGSQVGGVAGTAGAVTVYAAGTTHMPLGVVTGAANSGDAIEVFLQID